MGDYGKFTVSLSEEENHIIDQIIKEDTKGYKRHVLEERYPELNEKIINAAMELARDVIVHDAVAYMEKPIPGRVIGILKKLNYHEQADYLAAKYDLEPESINADICYYLCPEEIPGDYKTRAKE